MFVESKYRNSGAFCLPMQCQQTLSVRSIPALNLRLAARASFFSDDGRCETRVRPRHSVLETSALVCGDVDFAAQDQQLVRISWQKD